MVANGGVLAAVMVERSMRHPEEIRTAVGRRLANLSVTQAQYAGEDENSLLHGEAILGFDSGGLLSWCGSSVEDILTCI